MNGLLFYLILLLDGSYVWWDCPLLGCALEWHRVEGIDINCKIFCSSIHCSIIYWSPARSQQTNMADHKLSTYSSLSLRPQSLKIPMSFLWLYMTGALKVFLYHFFFGGGANVYTWKFCSLFSSLYKEAELHKYSWIWLDGRNLCLLQICKISFIINFHFF